MDVNDFEYLCNEQSPQQANRGHSKRRLKMAVASEKATMIPTAVENLSINQAGEVSTVLNPQTGHIFVINPVAERILQLCDGKRAVGEIIKLLSDEFAVPSEEQLLQDIEQFFT